MSQFNKLKDRLCQSVPHIDAYIQLEQKPFIEIAEYDIDATAYILTSINYVNHEAIIKDGMVCKYEVNKAFKITNAGLLAFIAIDGKNGLLGGTSNCDFVFFNDSHFCFVELKLNAEVLTERAIRKNRKKATEQLGNTIAYFDTQLTRNYQELTLEAFVATPDIYPRENTAWQSIRVKFLEEQGIDLYETRTKNF